MTNKLEKKCKRQKKNIQLSNWFLFQTPKDSEQIGFTSHYKQLPELFDHIAGKSNRDLEVPLGWSVLLVFSMWFVQVF